MTSTQNHTQARIDAAKRYFEINQGGRFLAAHSDGPDVVIIYASGLNGSEMRYRVSRNDIDLMLASEARRNDAVERLAALGLRPTIENGTIVLRLSVAAAEHLADMHGRSL